MVLHTYILINFTLLLGILFQLMVFILVFGAGISCWGNLSITESISLCTGAFECLCCGGGGAGTGGGAHGGGGIFGGGGGGGGPTKIFLLIKQKQE